MLQIYFLLLLEAVNNNTISINTFQVKGLPVHYIMTGIKELKEGSRHHTLGRLDHVLYILLYSHD